MNCTRPLFLFWVELIKLTFDRKNSEAVIDQWLPLVRGNLVSRIL
jgi:hypothetical protein